MRVASRRSAAASACCPASGACACRCPGPACRTATRGRSRPATGSSSSTPASTSRARSGISSARSTWCDLKLEHVRLLVCTHAHSDHYGQAATVVERAGCELWMHPAHEHMLRIRVRPRGRPARDVSRSRVAAASRRSRSQRFAEARRRPAERRRRDRRARLATSLPGVEVDDRPRRLGGVRDARARAVARLPVPARAPPADLAATTCSGASRSTTTTAGLPIRRASS